MSNYQGEGFVATIKRTKRRKSMAIKIISSTQVEVLIPATLSITTAHQFINSKNTWIQQKLANHAALQITAKTFSDGDTLYFLGRAMRLALIPAQQAAAINKTENGIEIVGSIDSLTTAEKKQLLTDWYQQQAEQYLVNRTQWWSQHTQLHPQAIQVKSYKARWGSCKINGDIQFNWLLIQAPEKIVDYVILHELCHLEQHNHSPAFWELVAQHMPDYKQRRQWLKQHGQQLEF